MNMMKTQMIAAGCCLLLLAACQTETIGRAVGTASPKTPTLREAQTAKFRWYEPDSFLLIAAQHLIKTGREDIMARAKGQSVWIDEDVTSPEVIVVYHHVYVEGPEGPQDFIVTIRPDGTVIKAKPIYGSM